MINKNLFKKAIASALCLATCLSVSVATSADTEYKYYSNIVSDAFGFSTIMKVMNLETGDVRYRACGCNDSGQLGIGNSVTQSTPVNIAGIDGASKIVTGNQCFYALVGTTLKVWGDNNLYQLGFDTGSISSPTTLLTGVEDIVVGAYAAYAVMTDGTVKAWGDNSYGQIGIGNTTLQKTPVTIPSLTNVDRVFSSANSKFAMAVLNDDTVKAWGKNSFGQLGIGNKVNQTTPVTIPNLVGEYENLEVIKMNASSTYAITDNETGPTLWSWGCNTSGQLGIGNTTTQTTPVYVYATSRRSINIYCNYSNSAYMTVNDELYGMGNNGSGQLGLGNTDNQSTPQLIMTDVLDFDQGLNCAAAVVNGVVKTWGVASSLGVNQATTQSNTPVTVTGIANCINVEIGRKNFYAVCCDNYGDDDENYYVKSWGTNTYGQLGLGTTTTQYTPAVAGF